MGFHHGSIEQLILKCHKLFDVEFVKRVILFLSKRLNDYSLFFLFFYFGLVFLSPSQKKISFNLDETDNNLNLITHKINLYYNLKFIGEKALNYIVEEMIKEENQQHQTKSSEKKREIKYPGEWENFMRMRIPFPYLGGKRKYLDANHFTVATIHNSLSEVYLLYPQYKQLNDVLDAAFSRIMAYKNGCAFNFWNLLTPNITLKRKYKKKEQPWVRRPTNFKLKTKFINNAANVTEDSDDTAQAYLAAFLRKKRKILNSEKTDSLDLLDTPYQLFDQYLDTNRKNRHWMNYTNGDWYETGAFLTWFGEEYKFKKWNPNAISINLLKILMHNAVFFAPISECFPHPFKPYIPYGTNDLCSTVNANILTTICAYNEFDKSRGAKNALRWLSQIISEGRYEFSTIYYPNRFSLPYSISEAYLKGAPFHDTTINKLKTDLIKLQNHDGSWTSRKIVNKRDTIQSTIYALNALVSILLKTNDETLIPYIEKGFDFLIKNIKYKNLNELYWKGGVFFSGGTVVKLILNWESDALTTSLAVKSIFRYLKYIENKDL